MKCSVAGCEGTAVIQWKRLLDDAATTQHLRAIHDQLAANAEEQKFKIRTNIALLEEARDNPPPRLTPGDYLKFQERAGKQLEQARADHEAVPTTFDLEHHRAGSYAALGHCEEHLHGGADNPDVDWYTREHVPGCDGSQECGCS